MSLFRMGETERAWEELSKCLPFTHEKVSVSPYVMPNSYGYNEEKQIDGESMQDWQTGSSNVVLKTFIRFVFGVEPQYKGLCIQPSMHIPFATTELALKVRGTNLVLKYSNNETGKRTFKINGEIQEGYYDDVMKLKKFWISNEFIVIYKEIVVDIL